MNKRNPMRQLALAVITLLLAVGSLSPTMLGPASAAAQEVNPYCNSGNSDGSVDSWLNEAFLAGEDVDCIDVAFVAQGDCYLEHSIDNRTNFSYYLTWVEVSGPVAYPPLGGVARESGGIVSLDDRGPGTVAYIHVDFRGPESGFVWGPDGADPGDAANWFVGQDDKPFAAWYSAFTGKGKIYEVSTDCAEPQYGCSQGFYKNNFNLPETTLGDLSLMGLDIGNYLPNTNLLDVLSNPGSGKVHPQKGQTYDGLIRQQVTAYLNTQYALNYPLALDEIFRLDQGTLEYYNDGGGVLGCEIAWH